jgi:predicted Zn-dependent protease
MSNGTTAVSVAGSAGKAQFSGGRFSGSMDDYILAVFRELTEGQMQLNIPPPQRTTINGLPAAYTTSRVRTQSGVIDVSVVAYQWEPQRIYHFVTITQGGTGIGAFTPMINSVRKIGATEAAAVRPRVIDVVTVKAGDTVQSLATRMAYRDFQLERFLSLNALTQASAVRPGQRVKLVVYGRRTA